MLMFILALFTLLWVFTHIYASAVPSEILSTNKAPQLCYSSLLSLYLEHLRLSPSLKRCKLLIDESLGLPIS